MPRLCRRSRTAIGKYSGVRLLFDQNLSPVCMTLAACFPSAIHVRDVGLREATTPRFGHTPRGAIITKDADFRQRRFLEGRPPKILWIRLGNCSTKTIENLVRSRLAEIDEFLADPHLLIL